MHQFRSVLYSYVYHVLIKMDTNKSAEPRQRILDLCGQFLKQKKMQNKLLPN